jgi:phosphate/sulfate permease
LIVLFAFLLGAALGWRRAARRGGDRLDRLQYATGHAIAFAIATLALLILGERLGFF